MTEEKKADIADAAGAEAIIDTVASVDAGEIVEKKTREIIDEIAEIYRVSDGLAKLYLYATQMFEDTSVRIVSNTIGLELHFRDNVYVRFISWIREDYYIVSAYKDGKHITSKDFRTQRRDFDQVIEIIKMYAKKYM